MEEIARDGEGLLKRSVIREAENFVFGVPYTSNKKKVETEDIDIVLKANRGFK